MRKHTKLLTRTIVLAAAGWLASCNSTIDDEPDVVLEIETLTIPPITASQNSTTGTCTYTITQASGTFKNLPKNQFAATSPFNDIVLQNVQVSYLWDDAPTVVTPTRITGIGGTVAANGSGTALFSVVANADLDANPPNGRAGHTATLAMVFNGTTVSGDAVSATAGGTLQVNSCTVNVGACCQAGGGCQTISQAACNQQGGQYLGDNTSCALCVQTP